MKTKKDIGAFLSTVEAVHLPILESARLTGITVYQGRNSIDTYYELPSEARYVFRVSTEPNSAGRIIAKMQANDATLQEMNPLPDSEGMGENSTVEFPEGVRVYAYDQNSENTKAGTRKFFSMDVQGDYVSVLVFQLNDLASATEGLQAFHFEKLSFTEDGATVSRQEN